MKIKKTVYRYLSLVLITFFSISGIYLCTYEPHGEVTIESDPAFQNSHSSFSQHTAKHVPTFKTKIKRKIKVRYRAMYCRLELTSVPATRITTVFMGPLTFTYSDHFLHDPFAYSFNLRGPPSHIS